jgi:hypothetical protein
VAIFRRILTGTAVVIAALLLGVFAYGRVSDGPVGFFSGGPLESGELVAGDVDWRFVMDVPTIEFQLLEPPRSRTVWIVVHEEHAYIPCGIPNFTLWKQWPHEAVKDGRGMLRIDGKRYPVQLEKLDDRALISSLLQVVGRKYDMSPGENPEPDSVWFFRVETREGS